MSDIRIQEQQQLINCPFNSSHKILQSKMIKHISKCGSYKLQQNQYKICKYNSLHIIKNAEINAHELSCSDRPEDQQIDQQEYELRENAFMKWASQQSIPNQQNNILESDSNNNEIPNQMNHKSKRQMKNKKKILKDSNQINISNRQEQQENPFLNHFQELIQPNKPQSQQLQNIQSSFRFPDNQKHQQLLEEEQKNQNNLRQDDLSYYNIYLAQQGSYLQVEKSADACFQLQNSVLYLNNNNFDEFFQSHINISSNQNSLEKSFENQNNNHSRDYKDILIPKQIRQKYIRKHIQDHNIPDYTKEELKIQAPLLYSQFKEYHQLEQMRGNRQRQNEIEEQKGIISIDSRNNRRTKRYQNLKQD